MAVNTRLSAPNYKIFEPDSLDAIYAKGMLDPQQGGIAFALSNAHRMDSDVNMNTALQKQDEFNRMAGALDKYELDQKRKEALGKEATTLLGHGFSTTDLDPTSLEGLLTPGGYSNNTFGKLAQDKLAAEAQALRAKAAADHTLGKETTTDTTTDFGTNTTTAHKYLGPPRTVATPTADPTGSTPAPASNNAAAAAKIQQTKNGFAAVGATSAGEVSGKYLPDGSLYIKNTRTNTDATVDPSGKVIRK